MTTVLQQALALRLHAPAPDLAEWRVDAIRAMTPADLFNQLKQLHATLGPAIPLLFTNRRRDEGGGGNWREAERLASIAAAARSGLVALVDVELAVPAAARHHIHEVARQAGVGVVISAHDFTATPDDTTLTATLTALLQSGADVAKFAVTAQTPDDALRLLHVASQVAATAPVPLITIAMGAYGTITRLAGPFYGAALSFATIGPTSAPGQLSLTLLRDYWHAVGLRDVTA